MQAVHVPDIPIRGYELGHRRGFYAGKNGLYKTYFKRGNAFYSGSGFYHAHDPKSFIPGVEGGYFPDYRTYPHTKAGYPYDYRYYPVYYPDYERYPKPTIEITKEKKSQPSQNAPQNVSPNVILLIIIFIFLTQMF